MIVELSCLGIDVICLGIFYRLYKNKRDNIIALSEAPELKLDNKLEEAVRNTSQCMLPYVVLKGFVRASYEPIPSQYLPNIYGVLQESHIIEHKYQWNPFSRFWSVAEHEIQSFRNSVPFHIMYDEVKVEVTEPLQAATNELALSSVYDKFTPKNDTLWELAWGWVKGERSKGFQVTEYMLTEGTFITTIGELTLDNSKLKLQPPSNLNLDYYLTTLTKDGLLKKFKNDSHVYHALTIVFGVLGAYLVSLCARQYYSDYCRKRDHKKKEAARKERRKLARESTVHDDDKSPVTSPICVVCLNNPVEVMIMDCNHVCLCLDCSEQVRSCPICRSRIAQTVEAFLP